MKRVRRRDDLQRFIDFFNDEKKYALSEADMDYYGKIVQCNRLINQGWSRAHIEDEKLKKLYPTLSYNTIRRLYDDTEHVFGELVVINKMFRISLQLQRIAKLYDVAFDERDFATCQKLIDSETRLYAQIPNKEQRVPEDKIQSNNYILVLGGNNEELPNIIDLDTYWEDKRSKLEEAKKAIANTMKFTSVESLMATNNISNATGAETTQAE
jgi:hypothetical protein